MFNETDWLSNPFLFLYKTAFNPSLSLENPFAELINSFTFLLLSNWKFPSKFTAPPILTTPDMFSSLISLKETLSPSTNTLFEKSLLSTSKTDFEKSSNLSMNTALLKALELNPPERFIRSETVSFSFISNNDNCLNPLTSSVWIW